MDELVKAGKLERLKNGPVYWVDSADKQPTIGTGLLSCEESCSYSHCLQDLPSCGNWLHTVSLDIQACATTPSMP